MEYEHIGFGEFLAARLKEKGFTLKKLAESTGITPVHLEAMLRDDFEALPSAPYLRGYLFRLGKTLEFSGDEWWTKIKNRAVVKNSGEADALPENRFIRKSPAKYVWAAIGALIVLIYLGFQFPRIFGKPLLALTFPNQNPYAATANTLMFTGTVRNADSLTLNGDTIIVNPDGTWQKGVLLDNGLNTFQITAKKFLGGESDITAQVVYQAPVSSSSTQNSVPAVHFETSTPVSGPVLQ